MSRSHWTVPATGAVVVQLSGGAVEVSCKGTDKKMCNARVRCWSSNRSGGGAQSLPCSQLPAQNPLFQLATATELAHCRAGTRDSSPATKRSASFLTFFFVVLRGLGLVRGTLGTFFFLVRFFLVSARVGGGRCVGRLLCFSVAKRSRSKIVIFFISQSPNLHCSGFAFPSASLLFGSGCHFCLWTARSPHSASHSAPCHRALALAFCSDPPSSFVSHYHHLSVPTLTFSIPPPTDQGTRSPR